MAAPFGTSKFSRRYTKATDYKQHESNSDIDDEHQSSSSRNKSTAKSQSIATTLNTLGDSGTVRLVDFGIPQHIKIATRIHKIVKHGKSYAISGSFIIKGSSNETKVVHSHQPMEIDPEPDIVSQYGHQEYQVGSNYNYLTLNDGDKILLKLQQNTKQYNFGTSKSKNCNSNVTFISW